MSSSQSKLTETHNRLLSELLSSHSSLESKTLVEISTQVPAGRGLVFTQDIRPDQLLLILPPPALLNPATLPKHLDTRLVPSTQAAQQDGIAQLTSVQALSVVLARSKASRRLQLANDDLDFDRFVRTLPENFDNVPLAWYVNATKEQDAKSSFYKDLMDALPSQSAKLLVEVRKRFFADWDRINALRQSDPALLDHPSSPTPSAQAVAAITLQDFLWSWLCINTRCVYFPLQLPSHGDNFTLAPMLDMANHTSKPALQCKVRYTSKDGLELFAPHPSTRSYGMGNIGLKKGDECFITYGAHSNASLLSEYGFVLPRVVDEKQEWKGNRYCEVRVDDQVTEMFAEQGQQGKEKVQILKEAGYWLDYSMHPCPGPPAYPSHRLVPALRLLALHNTNDTRRWEATLMGYEESVSPENEKQAHRILVKLCERIAEAYVPKRQALQRAKDTLLQLSDPACTISMQFVEQLLDEEEEIIMLVKEAAKRDEEW